MAIQYPAGPGQLLRRPVRFLQMIIIMRLRVSASSLLLVSGLHVYDRRHGFPECSDCKQPEADEDLTEDSMLHVLPDGDGVRDVELLVGSYC